MAWRIDASVIRGEIDNRTRDRVMGRIWLEGLAEPVELALAGNAWRDLAGRRVKFVNPVAVKKPLSADEIAGFAARQTGAIGGFIQQLGEAVMGEEGGAQFEDKAWSERAPQSEAEAEKMQDESDRFAERIPARLKREGPDADYGKILEEELARRARGTTAHAGGRGAARRVDRRDQPFGGGSVGRSRSGN